MDDERTRVRALLDGLVKETNTDLTNLARQANLAPTTLTRFMNNPDYKYIPSTVTLSKVFKAAGKLPPQAAVGRDAGVAEDVASGDSEEFRRDIASRMLLVRKTLASKLSDEEIAKTLGMNVGYLRAILSGQRSPTLQEFASFARRMRVTTDFILFDVWDGLERRTEQLLLKTLPDLQDQADTIADTDIGQAAHRTGPRR